MTRFATLIAGLSYLPSRLYEWALALHSLGFGIMLSQSPTSMDGPAFAALIRVMPEAQWALVFIFGGVAHIIALAVNGRRGWTPWARALTSCMVGNVWIAVAYLFYLGDPWTTAVPTYLLVAGIHVCGGFIACFEAGHRGSRHGAN